MEIKSNIGNCFRGDASPCGCACPFNLDVRGFVEKLQRGSFDAAFKIYRNAVVFPDIVARLCPQPCKARCVIRSEGDPIKLRKLEAASIRWARNIDPIDFNVPKKHKSIGIIGAGVSGLACAIRLASKKYDVTIYEKSDRKGGSLWGQLPEEIFLGDIDRQFKFEEYEIKFNTEITALEELKHDAVYIATGKGGNTFGMETQVRPDTLDTRTDGVFIGGEVLGTDTIGAITHGIKAAQSIETYLKVGFMKTGELEPLETTTRLKDEYFCVDAQNATQAQDLAGYSKDEAKAEAMRCLKCDCDKCICECDLMQYFKCVPEQVEEWTYMSFMKMSFASGKSKRMISACNMCGACEHVCPEHIDIGDFLLQSRHHMHREGNLPAAFHDFWIRDMEFTNGEQAAICQKPKGHATCEYMFFPGCQLGASDPRYVSETYRYLISKKPGTALMQCCCGAPADWAGETELHDAAIADIKAKWEGLGKPKAILACPTCKRMLKKYIPELEGVSLFEVIARWGIPESLKPNIRTASVFDPCSSREEPAMQQSVRNMLLAAGITLNELAESRDKARCCGWGGHPSIAHAEYAKEVTNKRIALGEDVFITYCTNCRDTFAKASKPNLHILDLLFGLNDEHRQPPTVSERRDNRIALKNLMLKEFWDMDNVENSRIKLIVPAALKARMDDDLILEDDIRTTIMQCEASGRKLIDSATGHFIGHLQIGIVTYWAEYSPCEGGFELHNAYCHRLQIQEADKLA